MFGLDRRLVPLAGTLTLFFAMIVFGAVSYKAFLAPQVFVNLFIDNAFLLIVAVGMTFVILSGGIDLSVGSVMAFSTMACAWLTVEAGLPASVVHNLAVPGEPPSASSCTSHARGASPPTRRTGVTTDSGTPPP